MHDNDVTRLWTDAELDAALEELHDDIRADVGALAVARTKVLVAARWDSEPLAMAEDRRVSAAQPARLTTVTRRTARRRSRAWLATAAASVLFAAAMTVAEISPLAGSERSTAEAAETLNDAARNAIAEPPDQPVGPGQYLYIRTHEWALRADGSIVGEHGGPPVAVLEETLREVWKPAKWADVWVLRRTETGRRRIVVGTEAQARAAGLLAGLDYADPIERARCGLFGRAPSAASGGCKDAIHGGWDSPSPAWIAGLPRDPEALYQRLRQDAVRDGEDDSRLLVAAADALRTGVLPGRVRAALYEALTYAPGLDVTERTTNLDGAKGTALGMTAGDGARQEIIVDPRTGQFIGERLVQAVSSGALEAGTVLQSTSVRSGVVDSDRVPVNP